MTRAHLRVIDIRKQNGGSEHFDRDGRLKSWDEMRRDRAAEREKASKRQKRARAHRYGPRGARIFLEQGAKDAGYSLEALLRTARRGRRPADEHGRYDLLAAMIVELRDRGATLELIGEALGRPRSGAQRLEARGRKLLADAERTRLGGSDEAHERLMKALRTGCRKHNSHRGGCPLCERSRDALVAAGEIRENLRNR